MESLLAAGSRSSPVVAVLASWSSKGLRRDGEEGQSLLLCPGLFPVPLCVEGQAGPSSRVAADALRWVLEMVSVRSLMLGTWVPLCLSFLCLSWV